MKSIKTAIIGFGLSGSKFHAPFIQALDEFELTAIVVRNVEVVRSIMSEIPVYENIDVLFVNEPDIELIIISTPTPTHYEIAKKAILAGKHVIIEKPFVVSTEEGLELIELAKQQNVVLSVYQNRRWDGDFMTVKDLMTSGELGTIHTIEMNWDRYRKEVRDRWKEASIPGSGVFYDIAPHLLDQTLQLCGFPQSIYGSMKQQREGSQVTDYFHVVLEYEDCSVLLRGGSLVSAETPRFVLHGTEGSYIAYGLDPQESQLVSGLFPNDEGFALPDKTRISQCTKSDGVMEPIEVQEGNYCAFFQQMARSIRDGEAVPVTAEDGLQVIRLIEAGIESSEEKKIITFQ